MMSPHTRSPMHTPDGPAFCVVTRARMENEKICGRDRKGRSAPVAIDSTEFILTAGHSIRMPPVFDTLTPTDQEEVLCDVRQIRHMIEMI